MYYRFLVFFIGSAICIGIVVAANDPLLLSIVDGGDTSTGAASPYVIAARNMAIPVLPSVINALLLTSIISAGNNYVFTASRSLYGMAERGFAPRFLLRVNRQGIPVYCLAITMLFCVIAFLQLSNSTEQVYVWYVPFLITLSWNPISLVL